MRKVLWPLLLIFGFALISAGCGKKQAKEGDEPTKYQSQAGLERLTQQAQQKLSQAANNSAFLVSRNASGRAAEVKDLDAVIRPVLRKIFGDANLVSESSAPQTKVDGEVLENRFTYVVKKSLVPKDGEPLHAALRSAGFSPSVRLGTKPTIWRGGAMMSFFRTTPLRSYSLEIRVDTSKQQIVVESYRLGSKYDRL